MKIIVANRGSYYHEAFWDGQGWTQNIEKAKVYPSNPTNTQLHNAFKELDQIVLVYKHANPHFVSKKEYAH